jgi:hypothetical protein
MARFQYSTHALFGVSGMQTFLLMGTSFPPGIAKYEVWFVQAVFLLE